MYFNTRHYVIVIAALLGYNLTEMDAIKNEYDAQLLYASLEDFTSKYVCMLECIYISRGECCIFRTA